jgi:hypothetical protein
VINLQDAYIRAYLREIDLRVARVAETLDWLDGEPVLNPAELVPGFDSDVDPPDESIRAFQRLAGQVQSLGQRAFRQRRTGAIGTANWGGDNKVTDERLTRLGLETLAGEAFKSLFAQGIAAAWAFTPASTTRQEGGGTEPRLQILGGYLEPLYHPDDPAGEPVGLYQVLGNPSSFGTRRWYRVRVYDFETESVRQWDGVAKPYGLASEPDHTWERQVMPAFVMFDEDQDGRPIGEAQAALPLLKQEVAAQMRVIRNSTVHAFGMFAFTGRWELPQMFGPTQVLMGDDGGTAQRIPPGEMTPLFLEHDRIMERIRADLSLPIMSIGTGGWPSGEAITQANQAFISASRAYATLLTDLLTRGVEAFTELAGGKPVPVSVDINREALRRQVMDDARQNYSAGIIDLRAAATEVHPYYPVWKEDQLEAFIKREETPLTGLLPPNPLGGEGSAGES